MLRTKADREQVLFRHDLDMDRRREGAVEVVAQLRGASGNASHGRPPHSFSADSARSPPCESRAAMAETVQTGA